MNFDYTNEINTQIVVALLKKHNIKQIIASPGTTNINLVASLQKDSFFKMYSAADERSAAYMACGMAAESNQPVVLTCTGATASRNYIPALTEAFYRNLPVLAITACRHKGLIGQNIPQVIDRTVQLNDIVNFSVQVPTVHSNEDKWACEVSVNKALLELKRNSGGPVHINLETTYNNEFFQKELPNVRKIERICIEDTFPILSENKVGIYVGNHIKWSEKLTESVDRFCDKFNAVVLCDHTSKYHGKFKVLASLLYAQKGVFTDIKTFDLIIDIGNVSGAYLPVSAKKNWRVNSDGEIRDTFKRLTAVFEMSEQFFFDYYFNDSKSTAKELQKHLIDEYRDANEYLINKIPELPFSNIWIAKNTASRLPANTELHLAILNSLRSWNFFEIHESINVSANTGGFGIDGCMSALIGASLVDQNKLYFLVTGDLAFFYDMNSLGNRHVGKNIRVLLINNGVGTEFKHYNHIASMFEEAADDYIAARGHYGKQSKDLIKHYSEDLGFTYLSAKNKDEYLKKSEIFLNPKATDKSIIFEVFTNSDDESEALKIINNLDQTTAIATKNLAKKFLGKNGIRSIKKILNKG